MEALIVSFMIKQTLKIYDANGVWKDLNYGKRNEIDLRT